MQESNEIIPEKVKVTSSKASLPPNTVAGKRTVVIPVSNSGSPIVAVNHAIQKYFEDSIEPLVILLAEPKFIPKVEDNIKKLKRKCLVYQFCGEEPTSNDKREEVRNYLQNPSGILVTEAEAFNGMQARNLIIIGGSSTSVRNYLMRGISFIVVIQKEKHLNTFLGHEQTGNLQNFQKLILSSVLEATASLLSYIL